LFCPLNPFLLPLSPPTASLGPPARSHTRRKKSPHDHRGGSKRKAAIPKHCSLLPTAGDKNKWQLFKIKSEQRHAIPLNVLNGKTIDDLSFLKKMKGKYRHTQKQKHKRMKMYISEDLAITSSFSFFFFFTIVLHFVACEAFPFQPNMLVRFSLLRPIRHGKGDTVTIPAFLNQ
jgi:hypothetical protein